jgi:hypothetical protein
MQRIRKVFYFITLQSLKMLWWNRGCYSFAFVLTPCSVEGDSFESFKSQFLRRLTISHQCCFTRDETIYRETIVQHLTDLGNISIPGFWVIQHNHHLADPQLHSFLVLSRFQPRIQRDKRGSYPFLFKDDHPCISLKQLCHTC